MPYELTQMRIYLQRFMKEIGDTLTTPEDIARYEDFSNKMGALSRQTDSFYNGQIPLFRDMRNMLAATYNEALEAAFTLVNSPEEAGPAGLRLKTIARELIPLMQLDVQALEQISMLENSEGRTLPELLGQVRMQAADLGDTEIPANGKPVQLRLESLDDVQRGTFTPAENNAAPRQSAAYSRLAGALGVPDLVARATPMLLMHKGGSTAGTFISRAEGIDPAQIGEGDPLLSFGTENFDTGAAVSGISSMGLLNCLVGMPEGGASYTLRFDRPYSTKEQPAKLVGLTVKPDSVSFGTAPVDKEQLKAQLGRLGVISAEMAAVLGSQAFLDQLRYTLYGCGLPEGTVERIMERRSILLEKIREDAEYYKDKAPGYVEPGRIRVVPEAEMEGYRLKNLADASPDGPFAALNNLPQKRKEELQRKAEEAKAEENGLPAPLPVTPTARVIGTGLMQEKDPLGTGRPETVKLHIPVLGAQTLKGGSINSRYPVGWQENGQTRKGVFTLPVIHSARARFGEIFQSALNDPNNAKYRDVLKAMDAYYNFSETRRENMDLPRLQDMPWKDLGIPEERANALKEDQSFKMLLQGMASRSYKATMLLNAEDREGGHRGQRIELRNVAMSDVGDVLGVPNLLARTVPARVELGGRIVDGVFMEEAEGIDLGKVVPGTAPAAITAAMNSDVFNTEGLKDLADLQILDYICMNSDRHGKNMFYKFSGLETGHPKFLGVQGIDNDNSFYAKVPGDGEDVSYLAKLNDIRVINESMAASLRSPGCIDRIVEKMRRNGLNEAQVKAAQDRFAKIKKKLDKGKLEIVKDGQWGKGKYRFETLGAGDRYANTSIFGIFRRTFVEKLNKMAEENPMQPGQYVPIKGMEVQTVERVESFSDATRRAAELAELEKQAEEAFLKESEAATKTGPLAENPEHQAIFALHSTAAALKAQLDAGSLPWPWGNRSYRKMHSACEELLKYTGEITDKLRRDPQAELSAEDSKKLNRLIVDFNNKSVAYSDYKKADLETYAAGRSTGRRMQAAKDSNDQMTSSYSAYRTARKERQKPIHLVHEKIREIQGGLGVLSGDALRRKAAQIIYLNGLSRMDIDKKTGMGVRRAMTEVKLNEQTQRVLESPAFRKLAALPDRELRALAAGHGGFDLANKYIQEIAKEQQIQRSPKNPGYQAPAPEQAQPNVPGM